MNADLLTILEYWEREKGISRDILLNAVEEALISAAKKAVGPARDLRVQIDPKSGDIRAYATLLSSNTLNPNTIIFPFKRPNDVNPMPKSGKRSKSK